MAQYGTGTPQPPGQAAGGSNAQHKRVYQACIPCRRRKVRCDLGSVDNPNDPPCVRCRRESKECFFSATRRKRKNEDEGSDVDDYTVRNGRKRQYTNEDTPPAIDRRVYSDAPLTPGGSQGRSQPLRRPDGSLGEDSFIETAHRGSDFGADQDGDQQMENPDAQTMMRRGLYGPHDALDLLYKAATDTHTHTDRFVPPEPSSRPEPTDRPNSNSPHLSSHNRQESRTSGVAAAPPPRPSVEDLGRQRSQTAARGGVKMEQPVDPELGRPNLTAQPGYAEAIKTWMRFRFVRAGWFTPQEAIEYIDYYYKFLSPMTPISPPTFSNPASHINLLNEEPILSVTLLTIASRYKHMPGTGGHCRSHAIHEQLWTYLRGMIERCLWGQEAFGGGFCGSGAQILDETQTSSTAPWRGMRKGSLRTLGTIESLLILTEWHPRALHFPPQEATDELMLPDFNERPTFEDDPNRTLGAGFGGKRLESWLEPAWRSDRMCWMLLSTAMGLGYELGVFDDIDELLKDDAITRPEYLDEGYRQRANRIKRLLLIYTTQLAGRLNWTSMAPEHLRRADPAITRKRPFSNEENTPGTALSSHISNNFAYVPDLELDDQIIHCWAAITNAMHLGNERLFRSRQYTAEIIQSGRYVDLMRDFTPLLRDWHKEFERFRLPPYLRHILTIEYQYVRIYINSLSLQAVVERCTTQANNNSNGNGLGGAGSNENVQLSPQTILNYGKLPLGQLGGFTVNDQESIREVVDGCRALLHTVVDGLLPGDFLKHAPVRTYFRIISGAMFLLKTFALGAPRSDVKMSIDLMDRAVEGLRNCVVDDVHLGIRFADLLETLTSRLRNRFIQAPTMQQASGKGQSPVPDINGQTGVASDPNWVGKHAQSLREELNGNHRMPDPSTEPNNISATPFDLTTSNFPYPGGASLGPATPAAAVEPSNPNALGTGMDAALLDEWNTPGNEMWYLPTGPAFFQNMGSNDVSMTAEGVNVGGLDLLDYMAMDPVGGWGDGAGGSNGFP